MRTAKILAAAVAFMTSAPDAFADELVAVVDLKFIRETEITAAFICFGEAENDCGVWAHHYLWEARIRKVISGEESRERFLVLFGQHALKKKDLHGVVVAMTKLGVASHLDAQYQVSSLGEEHQIVCFSKEIEHASWKRTEGVDRPLSCFDAPP